MSEASAAAPTNPPEAPREAPTNPAVRPPVVRLPTWVNVVLVLTLLASCSAASTAGDAVDRLVGSASENLATDADVRDMCRLLASVAAAQAVDLDATFAGGDAAGTCETAAREVATP